MRPLEKVRFGAGITILVNRFGFCILQIYNKNGYLAWVANPILPIFYDQDSLPAPSFPLPSRPFFAGKITKHKVRNSSAQGL